MATQIFHLLHILFFLMISAEQTDSQSTSIKQVKEGESVSINCEFSSKQDSLVGVYLRRKLSNPIDLIYVHKSRTTLNESYINRIEFKGEAKNFTIRLKNLQENDTDIYYCVFGVRRDILSDQYGQGTMLIVSELKMEHHADCSVGTRNYREISHKDPIVIGVIATSAIAIICALILLFWNVRKCIHRESFDLNLT
ncbi:T-cell antigen CD7-like [Scyliorhinus canicula]|uniref:T-cell antigen CD7-like n=1 Tax=Scyliorhinus canicula TaxID=7830 RepID=UPI0018F3F918|nr:T-cell antigen CD7-like [Scyliorhinus canicula]